MNGKSVLLILVSGLFFISGVSGQNNKAVQEAFKKSYTYEYSGEYTKGIDALKEVYDLKSYEINLRLGWLNYMAGFFIESQAYYQKAVDLMPMSVEARLGYVYPASAQGNWEQVKSQYNEILKIDPQNSLVNYRMGSIFYGNEDYETALKYFEKVVNLYPFDFDGVVMFAYTNLKLGKYREAEVLFNKALMIRPEDPMAKDGLMKIK